MFHHIVRKGRYQDALLYSRRESIEVRPFIPKFFVALTNRALIRVLDDLCRISGYNSIIWDIFCYNAAGGDNGPFPDRDTF